jgi:DGQHR domain-containing protein
MTDTPANRITFRCLEVVQPIGTFYIGAIDSADLVAISYADIRRLEKRDVEKYLGIERPLNSQRVDEIQKYVNTVDATFPTAVILAVKSEDAEFDERLNAMALTRHDGVAKIIDGQHRIAGLKGYRGPAFVVNVAIFVDMDLEDQATVFATINLAQTKVGKSLVYDLYDYATSRSPQKTAHNIARVLNREKGSPFQDRIKILGIATPGKKQETITQANFVESLLPYLTRDPIGDRDALKREKKLDRYPADQKDARFLRNLFLDERDADITVLVWNYFTAVQRRWTNGWTTKTAGNILNRGTGFRALMRLFRGACQALGFEGTVPPPKKGPIVPIERFETLFARVKLNEEDFSPERFKPGTSGESDLFKELQTQTGVKLL